MPSSPAERLAALLKSVSEAHHDAFASTDGEDPDWPLWYAEHMVAEAGDLLPVPAVDPGEIPWLTAAQMAEADRLAIEEFNVGLLQMMEHAGTALAWAVMHHAPTGTVSVLAGGGNNGAGGMCAARHLVNRGRRVEVVIGAERLGGAAEHHLKSLARMGVPVVDAPGGEVAVDALVGYGLHGPLTGRPAELAHWTRGRTTVSLDLPSGVGFAGAVEPTVTVTLAAPKIPLRHVRPLYLADIGWPGELWHALGVEPVPSFAWGSILAVAP